MSRSNTRQKDGPLGPKRSPQAVKKAPRFLASTLPRSLVFEGPYGQQRQQLEKFIEKEIVFIVTRDVKPEYEGFPLTIHSIRTFNFFKEHLEPVNGSTPLETFFKNCYERYQASPTTFDCCELANVFWGPLRRLPLRKKEKELAERIVTILDKEILCINSDDDDDDSFYDQFLGN